MCKLSDIENKIIKERHSVGNDVLYKLCKKHHLSKKEQDYIAAQMWLIGRSYAASPERRDYDVPLVWTNSGNGLDSYFELLANKLLSDKFKEEFNSIIGLFSDCDDYYACNNSINDIKILTNSIKAVLNFNNLLKAVRLSVDFGENENSAKKVFDECLNILSNKNGKESNNKREKIQAFCNDHENNIYQTVKSNQNNMISFCSKFLHFHFPNYVFIIDSLTESHFKGKNKKVFKFYENESEITISNDEVNQFIDQSNVKNIIDNLDFSTKNISDDPRMKYIKHCVREYLLATKIKNSIKNDANVKFGTYIPRVIDTYMLIANSNM